VNLRLPQRPVRMTGSRVAEVSWWLIPIGLLAAWIFFSTVVLVSDMLTAANTVGLLDGAGAFLVSDSPENALWTSTLGQVGLLEGDSLHWAELTESYTRTVLSQFIWQVSIALLYLAWIAIGSARRMRLARQPHGRLIEG
jgi:heme/copper-type cytochrome/quinol oxidase subunit 2